MPANERERASARLWRSHYASLEPTVPAGLTAKPWSEETLAEIRRIFEGMGQ